MGKEITMKICRWAAVVCFIFGMASSQLWADQKSNYDVVEPGLAKTSGGPFLGWKLTRSVSEVAVLPGGYFTFGTSAGVSASTLDDNCGILFGHPYAKTSYPFFKVDGGAWKRADMFFNDDSAKAVAAGDSIVLTLSGNPGFRATVTYRLLNNGQQLRVTSTIANLDAIAHSFGSGLFLDPALGIRGDGVLALNGAEILKETWLSGGSVSGKTVLISERRGAYAGLKCSLEFPSAVPTIFAAGNWDELRNADAAIPAGSLLPTQIYDLVLKMYWDAQTIAPGESASSSLQLSLQSPQFGTSAFARWDVPRFLSMNNGIMFPEEFPSSVAVISPVGTSATVQVTVGGNAFVYTPIQSKAVVLGTAMTYASYPLSVKSVYEGIVTELTLTVTGSPQISDSLVIPVFIPATPISDTGLTVTIDSIAAAKPSAIGVFFEAEKTAQKQRVYSLGTENIFLYEDGTRIKDFGLSKDTSGGGNSADIVFVLDVTGSMADEITSVKNNIIEFADSLSSRGVDYRLGMVTFLDLIENVYDFTPDVVRFKSNVALQYAHAGGDEPENSLDALYRAADFPFRTGASRIIIWITDATYHEKNANTPRTKTDIINKMLENDIVVNSIGPVYNQTDWYLPITDPTGGRFFDINGNFRDIFLEIGRLNGSSRFVVSYASPSTESGQHEVKIDVHYGGLGGAATITYLAKGAGKAGSEIACFPNPFNPIVTIRYTLPATMKAQIVVYNVLGQQVRTFDVSSAAASSEVTWDARDNRGALVASGVYLIRLTSYSAQGAAISSAMNKVIYLK